jgi:hypothetical protein
MRGPYLAAEGRYLDITVQDTVFLEVDQGREHALENSGHMFLFHLEEHVVHEVPGATTTAIFQHHLRPVSTAAPRVSQKQKCEKKGRSTQMLSALGFLKEARHCTISGHSRHIWSRATSSGFDSVKTFTATSSPVGL